MAFAIMQFPAVVAGSLKGSTITFFWILLTHTMKDHTAVCSVEFSSSKTVISFKTV